MDQKENEGSGRITEFFAGDSDYNKSNSSNKNVNLGKDYVASYDFGVITGARGCPYKCSYCSQRLITGLTYRWHSTERVLETLDILINKYGQESIQFYDDNFSVNRN